MKTKKSDLTKTLNDIDQEDIKQIKYDVFISYRRKTCWHVARLLHERLTRRGLKVFLDIEGLHTGDYDEDILRCIDNCKNFLIVLSKGDLDRCKQPGDWIEIELSRALAKTKPIIPVTVGKFTFPEDLPASIKGIVHKQCQQFSNSFYEDSMNKIESELKGIKRKPKFNIKQTKHNDYYAKNNLAVELKRLLVLQNIERNIDTPIFNKIFKKYDKIRAVAVGVDDGVRVMDRLGNNKKVEKIVMTETSEYSLPLLKKFASNKVKVYPFSMSKPTYASQLMTTIGPNGKKYNLAFICHSLYGTHKPLNVIKAMYEVLEPGGTIIVMDIDDGLEINCPDDHDYFARLNQIRFNSPWSGNRYTGRQTFGYLKRCGFSDIKLENAIVDSSSLTHQQRWELFNAEYGRVRSDLVKLIDSTKDNEEHKANLKWLDEHWDEIEMEFLSEDFFSCYGYMIWTATKK